MIRTLSLIKRRSDLDRSEFREHYEEIHAPLALPLMSGLERYVRYHVDAIRVGAFEHDVMTAFWYRDREATLEVFAAIESERGRAILEDEQTFMDKPANVFFAVSERQLVAGDEGEDGLFVLLRRPHGMSRFDASARLAREHWPELLSAFGAVDHALLRDAFPVDGGALPFDSVLQVRAPRTTALEAWAARMMADGYGVAAVETRAYETPMGSA